MSWMQELQIWKETPVASFSHSYTTFLCLCVEKFCNETKITVTSSCNASQDSSFFDPYFVFQTQWHFLLFIHIPALFLLTPMSCSGKCFSMMVMGNYFLHWHTSMEIHSAKSRDSTTSREFNCVFTFQNAFCAFKQVVLNVIFLHQRHKTCLQIYVLLANGQMFNQLNSTWWRCFLCYHISNLFVCADMTRALEPSQCPLVEMGCTTSALTSIWMVVNMAVLPSRSMEGFCAQLVVTWTPIDMILHRLCAVVWLNSMKVWNQSMKYSLTQKKNCHTSIYTFCSSQIIIILVSIQLKTTQALLFFQGMRWVWCMTLDQPVFHCTQIAHCTPMDSVDSDCKEAGQLYRPAFIWF